MQSVRLIFFLLLLISTNAYAQQHADSIAGEGHPLREDMISGFKVLNTDLPIDSVRKLEKIRLGHNQNSFSILVGSANATTNKAVTYLYKLEGADEKWLQAQAGYVHYTLLPPGTYRFKVRTNQSQAAEELVIMITLPFWLRTPFIILGSILFFVLIYSFHRIQIKRLLAVETVRHKVARDLHDDIGSTLSTITILSAIAKTKITEDPVKAGEYLGKINENSVKMMEVMDDIVWSINPANDNMKRITSRMRHFASEVLEPINVKTEFYFQEAIHSAQMDMENRRDLFLFFKEAVNNIAKHAHATEVKISMILHSKCLTLTVSDNGKGFDSSKESRGNGLHNMQKRSDNLGANLSIVSHRESGTVVSLEIKFK